MATSEQKYRDFREYVAQNLGVKDAFGLNTVEEASSTYKNIRNSITGMWVACLKTLESRLNSLYPQDWEAKLQTYTDDDGQVQYRMDTINEHIIGCKTHSLILPAKNNLDDAKTKLRETLESAGLSLAPQINSDIDATMNNAMVAMGMFAIVKAVFVRMPAAQGNAKSIAAIRLELHWDGQNLLGSGGRFLPPPQK